MRVTTLAVLVLALAVAVLAGAESLPPLPYFERMANETERRQLAFEDVRSTCEQIGRKLGSVSFKECMGLGLEPSGSRSVKGTAILRREFPPVESREPLGRVLLFGGIHGDEYSSVSIVFKWLEKLESNHTGLFHWRVVPLVNPDGLLRRPSQRMNQRGVDLNRNFPSPNWLVEANDYWVRRTSRNPRRYPGKAPLSEPETRFLVREIESFRPSVLVAVHAPISVVDFDGPSVPPDQLGSLFLRQMGTYPGSLGRWAGVHEGMPVVTIELPSAGILPSPAEQSSIWVDLVSWLKKRVPEREITLRASVAAGGHD